MRDNPIQFAVVREDPLIEVELMLRFGARRVLLIGSGGCTAFTLAARFPDAELTLLDPNKAQLDLVQRKLLLLSHHDRDVFNIENADAEGLNACGNFESLFRGFSAFIDDLICPKHVIADAFRDENALPKLRHLLYGSPYWPVAFEMFFCESLLRTMFGPEAIQHAPKGSYPAHFRKALTDGLNRSDAFDNYFLHHIFLGYYLDRQSALPEYLKFSSIANNMKFVCSTLQDFTSFADFDLIHLSNVFDWMSEKDIASISHRLSTQMHAGAVLVLRQLNHDTDFAHHFGPHFQFNPELERDLLARDRSLFYSKLNVGVRK